MSMLLKSFEYDLTYPKSSFNKPSNYANIYPFLILFLFRWPVRTVSFNHTGEFIAYASEDPFIDIANVETGRSVHQIPCKAAMNSVEWNPKYNLLAYAGDDKNKYLADEGVFRIFGFETHN
uniref:Pco114428 n=1 Tax=Arundo donax TaxID=35708 RepID=A0A0A9DAX5_ARUDO